MFYRRIDRVCRNCWVGFEVGVLIVVERVAVGDLSVDGLSSDVGQDAEAGKPASEQTGDPVSEGNVDLSKPSLTEPHHEHARGSYADDDSCYRSGAHWSLVPPRGGNSLGAHRGEIRLDFCLYFDLTRAVLAFDANSSDSS